MNYRKLGRTGLDVSVLGLGSGGASSLGQTRHMPQPEVTAFVRGALDLGVNLIDTAAGYDQSEAQLGNALAGVPRESYVLCTKFHTNRNEVLASAGSLRPSVEESLRRLKTDHVDVLYLQSVSANLYQAVMDRFWGDLQALQRDGLVRYAGITESYGYDSSHELPFKALADGVFDVLMVGFNIISPLAGERVIPLAGEKNTGVVIMGPVRAVMSQPDLLRNFVRQWKQQGLIAADALPDEGPLDWVLSLDVETLTAAAYKFAAEPAAVSSVLTGTADFEHLKANVRAILGPPLPAEATARIKRLFVPLGVNVQEARASELRARAR